MTNEELEKMIDVMKNNAVITLNKLLCVPDGYSSIGAKQFVDCIVSVVLLEVGYVNKRAAKSYKEVKE